MDDEDDGDSGGMPVACADAAHDPRERSRGCLENGLLMRDTWAAIQTSLLLSPMQYVRIRRER